MALEPPLFLQDDDYSARQFRLIFDALVNEGVFTQTDLEVVERGAGPNMSVDVSPGSAVVQGTAGANQGKYLARAQTTQNVAITAANPGNPRIDLVCVVIRDSNVAGANDDAIIQVVAGTPGGSPVAPALPDSALPLATVRVEAGTTNIESDDITDVRYYAPRGIFPTLTVGPVGTPTLERQPVSIFAPVDASASGGEDFAPVVVAPRATGDFTGVPSLNPGFFFAGNWFAHIGPDAGDGAGLEHFIGLLIEASILSDADVGEIVGAWSEAAFLGTGADTAHVGTMICHKFSAPKRKDGNTGGTADIVYGAYYDGVDPADLGADEGSTIYIGDAGSLYVTGGISAGEGLGLDEAATIFFGNCQMTVTDPGGNLVLNHDLEATGINVGTGSVTAGAFTRTGDFGRRIIWGSGPPEGIVFASPGAFYLDIDDPGTGAWAKLTGVFENGWVRLQPYMPGVKIIAADDDPITVPIAATPGTLLLNNSGGSGFTAWLKVSGTGTTVWEPIG